jgi:diguanylate cyclase (GGDEF)-like protein
MTAKQALDNSLMKRAEEHMQGIELALAMTKRNMLQLATHFSADKSLNLLFLEAKKAVEADGINSIAAAKIRKMMLASIKPGWDKMTEEFDVRQLHYHLGPGSLSFLRAHKPSKFGDRMDEIRYTIVDTNAEKKARTGFETGRVYSGIRGVVPIFSVDPIIKKEVHMGALEVGTSYSAILANIDKINKIGSAVLLTKAHVEKNIWPEAIQKSFGRVIADCDCFIESSSRSVLETKNIIMAPVIRDLMGNSHNLKIIEYADKYYILYKEPLRDYRGSLNSALADARETILWDDVTQEINKFYSDIKLNIFYGIFGFFLIEIVLFFTLRVERKFCEMNNLIGMDGLTTIPNRRDFETTLANEINRAKRYKQPLSLVMCDIDYFKLYNDFYGHVEGDECLRKVALALADSLNRAGDYVARYGGEEFVFILPNMTVKQAVEVTEKARLAMMDLAIEHEDSKVNSIVTMSFGVVSVNLTDGMTATSIINSADECLYQAKEQGRNCVVS